MRRFEVGDKSKYVRIRNIVRDQFVEFDFAIDDPRLYVELILPKKAFDEFCIANQVTEMTPEQCQLVDEDGEKWRYGTQVSKASYDSLMSLAQLLLDNWSEYENGLKARVLPRGQLMDSSIQRLPKQALVPSQVKTFWYLHTHTRARARTCMLMHACTHRFNVEGHYREPRKTRTRWKAHFTTC